MPKLAENAPPRLVHSVYNFFPGYRRFPLKQSGNVLVSGRMGFVDNGRLGYHQPDTTLNAPGVIGGRLS
jgi:hypothetical protein